MLNLLLSRGTRLMRSRYWVMLIRSQTQTRKGSSLAVLSYDAECFCGNVVVCILVKHTALIGTNR